MLSSNTFNTKIIDMLLSAKTDDEPVDYDIFVNGKKLMMITSEFLEDLNDHLKNKKE